MTPAHQQSSKDSLQCGLCLFCYTNFILYWFLQSQPTDFMDGPQRYQQVNEEEPEFSVECFNKLNYYLIGRCIPPRRKAKSYIFVTKLNILMAIFLCGCCSCPFLYFAHRWAQSVSCDGLSILVLIASAGACSIQPFLSSLGILQAKSKR